MYNRTLFPLQQFPERLFPDGIGQLVHKYSEILKCFQTTIQASGLFSNTRTPIVIHDNPFPINGGPCAYIIPEESHAIESQHMGAGRFFYGFDGFCTVRIIGNSLKDYSYSDTLRLTDDTTGLLKIAHKVIDLVDLNFAAQTVPPEFSAPIFPEKVYPESLYPYGIFPRSNSTLRYLTQEPIILQSHGPINVWRKAEEWSGIDLRFRFPYTIEFQNTNTFDDPIGPIPLATDMGELLKSLKSRILKQGFLNDFQAMISLYDDPFPLVGGPYCFIRPNSFRSIDRDKYGAGRDFATMEGTFQICPVVHNITDISGYADNAISGTSSQISLYSCVQYLIEQLCLSFLKSDDGNFIAEVPLDLVEIGRPRYLRRASSYLTLPLIFKTKYQERLT